jgi:hypothetical protein
LLLLLLLLLLLIVLLAKVGKLFESRQNITFNTYNRKILSRAFYCHSRHRLDADERRRRHIRWLREIAFCSTNQ